MSTFNFYKHQPEIAEKAVNILKSRGLVYLAIEMRVGKTLIAMLAAEMLGVKNVIFLTKKKALSSIRNDFTLAGFKYNITILNYEQYPKNRNHYDLYILDEAHSLSTYPKPNKTVQLLQKDINNAYVIFLSGTPTPESFSQIFNQLSVSIYSPFKMYASFYKWANDYVVVKQRVLQSGMRFNDYSNAKKEDVLSAIEPYFIRYKQEDAGFKQVEIKEYIRFIDLNDEVLNFIHQIKIDKVIEVNGSKIIADTPVKVLSKIHQLSSGTIKADNKITVNKETGLITEVDGERFIIDDSKAQWIKEKFVGKKIAIYYNFIAEKEAIQKTIPNTTESPDEFNQSTDKVFISQIQSGSMGVNLSTAEYLIFYNINFSATHYWQARARMQDINRTTPSRIVYLFSNQGIESKVYDTVKNKKDFTLAHFRKLEKEIKQVA
ncbi:MAG: SNF2-related protein [Candidatus Kapabacteria bacterium]|nr:SNF2-related protein [Candidatus Kapabacteria bacterium]